LPNLGDPENIETLQALAHKKAQVVLFIRAGIETMPAAPALLAAQALRHGVGAAGGLVRDADGKIVHAGMAIGPDGFFRSIYSGLDPGEKGYFGLLLCAREVDGLDQLLWCTSRENLLAAIKALKKQAESHTSAYQSLIRFYHESGVRLIFDPRAKAVIERPIPDVLIPAGKTPGKRMYPASLSSDPPCFRIRS